MERRQIKNWMERLSGEPGQERIEEVESEISQEAEIEFIFDCTLEALNKALDGADRLLLVLYFAPSEHRIGMHHILDHIGLVLSDPGYNGKDLSSFASVYKKTQERRGAKFTAWYEDTLMGWGFQPN